MEAKILKIKTLRLNVKNSDLEFWFLLRRDGHGFFGIRLTYPYKKEQKEERGELRHELAHLMVILSEPNPKDIVLDSFAGHGAIPFERAISFPYQKIIALEKEENLISELKQKLKAKKNIRIEEGDGFSLENIQNNCIDKIVTDPPWGIYKETEIPLEEFYSRMLKNFSRILKNTGILVLLIGKPEIFESALSKYSQIFHMVSKYCILVSGKKAVIYKITKTKRNELVFI